VSDVRVSVLTPPGTGAIATVQVVGPEAWERVRELFVGEKPLPEMPELHRFWFGKFAGDDVILAVKQLQPEPIIEVQCHGGRRIVQQVIATCGFPMRESARPPVAEAPTLRTASILLDQFHGAFDRAVRSLLDSFDPVKLAELAAFAPLGRHLVSPWKVAIAGAPNVGKSSLVNALAGYQRSIVSEIPGTTRDVVTVQLAFDGWPVELADTAGLREAAGLEADGIRLAEQFLSEADLVLWVLDASVPPVAYASGSPALAILNKCDLPAERDAPPDAIRVSARTGEGIAGLAAIIANRLVPVAPLPGAAVPYTPRLADLVERAAKAANRDDALQILRECLDS